jgi:hypothetical protein
MLILTDPESISTRIHMNAHAHTQRHTHNAGHVIFKYRNELNTHRIGSLYFNYIQAREGTRQRYLCYTLQK